MARGSSKKKPVDDEEEKHYVVERIVDFRFETPNEEQNEIMKRKYLLDDDIVIDPKLRLRVQWKGCAREDTWEPVAHLQESIDGRSAIMKFFKKAYFKRVCVESEGRMPSNQEEGGGSITISMVVEAWKRNQGEQHSPIYRIKGYPWCLRLFSRNGRMQLEVLCDKSKESELWQCDVRTSIDEPFDVCEKHHLSSWEDNKCIIIGELSNDIPIHKGNLLEVKITTYDNGNKWTCRPFLDPAQTCDLVFVIGEEQKNIRVHKEFLMSHSPFFGELFTDFTDCEIPIEDVEYEEFSNIIAMACGFDSTPLTDENVCKVLELARRFELKIVEDRVVSYLLSSSSSLAIYQKFKIAEDLPFLKDTLLSRYDRSALENLVKSEDFDRLSSEILKILFVKNCWIYRRSAKLGREPRAARPKILCQTLDPLERKDGILVIKEKRTKKKFKVNKKALTSQSTYFDQLFNGQWREKDMKEIHIPDVDIEEFDCIMAILYGSECSCLKDKNMRRILQLGNRFDLKIVEDRVISFLLSIYSSYLSIHEKLLIADQNDHDFLRETFLSQYKSDVQLKALGESQDWNYLSSDTLRVLFKTFCCM